MSRILAFNVLFALQPEACYVQTKRHKFVTLVNVFCTCSSFKYFEYLFIPTVFLVAETTEVVIDRH